jgi:hypothetical protein
MSRKKHSAEEIISKLREVEVLLAQGKKMPKVSRILGGMEQTYGRRRKVHGGLKKDQAGRLKELERETARLKKAVADLTLDKLVLQDTAKHPRLGRLWLNNGSCIRLRPSWKNHVWSYHFVQERRMIGRATAGMPAEGRSGVQDAGGGRRVQSGMSGDPDRKAAQQP